MRGRGGGFHREAVRAAGCVCTTARVPGGRSDAPATIQGAVDAFRAALGENNGNTPGPLDTGRREINWDGGGSTATSPAPNPFDGFLGNRGARFTTLGTGFVQAPLDGLATTFKNPRISTRSRPSAR